MKRVLVTAIGTAASTTIVKKLKESGCFFVLGADIVKQNEVATSLDVDEYYTFPSATDEGYVSFALEFCKDHHVDYYFAIIDIEVVNITKNKDLFYRMGTKLCLPDYEVVRLCHYKEEFYRWIKRVYPDIAIHQYDDHDDLKSAQYPLFIKPNEGAASRGCKKVDNYDALIAAIEDKEIGRTILVHDYIDGRLLTVDCIRNRKTKQELIVPRKEYLRNTDGCGIAVEIIRNEELEKICHHLIDNLDLNGIVNIEFFETENGYKIVEINPRHSAGVIFSCMAGADFVLNAINIADEKPCAFGDVLFGTHYTKRYEAYKMD